jgi:hypothetical protein
MTQHTPHCDNRNMINSTKQHAPHPTVQQAQHSAPHINEGCIMCYINTTSSVQCTHVQKQAQHSAHHIAARTPTVCITLHGRHPKCTTPYSKKRAQRTHHYGKHSTVHSTLQTAQHSTHHIIASTAKRTPHYDSSCKAHSSSSPAQHSTHHITASTTQQTLHHNKHSTVHSILQPVQHSAHHICSTAQ